MHIKRRFMNQLLANKSSCTLNNAQYAILIQIWDQRSGVFLRIFTVAFLLFLAPVGGL